MSEEKISLNFRQMMVMLMAIPLLVIGSGIVLGLVTMPLKTEVVLVTPAIFPQATSLGEENLQLLLTPITAEDLVIGRLAKEFAVIRQKLGLSWKEYQALIIAEELLGIPHQVLAAVYRYESSCGKDPKMRQYDPYRVLAGKPEQLRALERICRRLGTDPKRQRCAAKGELGPFQILPLTFERHATDGNNDGRADPWNLEDSAATAAKYLEVLGYKTGTPWTAVARYNGGNYSRETTPQQYAEKVLRLAKVLGAPLKL